MYVIVTFYYKHGIRLVELQQGQISNVVINPFETMDLWKMAYFRNGCLQTL